MAKLNKYKIINFWYGEKRDRLMCDETVELLGENTQIEATNSLGKTTTIQTILQSINPLMDLGERKAINLYTSTEPMYVLTEWLLDDEKHSIITGIALKRKSNNEVQTKLSKYDLFTFCILNDEKDKIEIDDLDILYVKDNKKVCITLTELNNKLLKLKKQYSNRINIFGKHKIKEYKNFLYKFGFDVVETCNILSQLNKEENSLTNFLEDCKTVENLFKNKIIPIIDEKIKNDNNKKIDSLKEMVSNLYKDYDNNKSLLKEYDDYIKFIDKLESLKIVSDKLVPIKAKIESNKKKLVYALKILNDKIYKLKDDIELINDDNFNISNKIFEYNYLNDCLDYTKEKIKYEELSNELKDKEYILNTNNINIKKLDNMLLKLDIEDLECDYNDNISEKSLISSKLEKAKMNQKDIAEKLYNIGFTLNKKYNELIQSKENELNDLKLDKSKVLKEIKSAKVELNTLLKEKDELNTAKIKAETNINNLDNTLKNKEKNLLRLNYEGNSISEILDLISKNTGEIDNLKVISREKRESINKFDSEIESLKNSLSDLNIELEIANKDLDSYKTKLSKINTLIDNIKIDEIYLENSTLSEEIEKNISNLKNKVTNLTIQKNEIKNSIDMLKSNKSVNLDDELVNELKKNDINPISGLDYLLNSCVLEADKLSLLDKNPLLTYSIIVTQKEYDRLLKLNLNTILENIVPVLIREHLFEDDEFNTNNNILNLTSKISILNNFNKALINKDETQKLILLKEKQVVDINNTIYEENRCIDELLTLKSLLNDECFILHYDDTLNVQITDIYNKKSKILENKNNLDSLKRTYQNDIINIDEKINKLEKYKHNLNEIMKLLKEKDNCCNELNSLNISLDSYKKDILLKESNINKVQEIISEKDDYKNDLINEVAKKDIKLIDLKEKTSSYNVYDNGIFIEGSINELEAQFNAFKKDVNLDETNELNDKLVKLNKKIKKLSDKISKKKSEYDDNLIFEEIVFDKDILEKKKKDILNIINEYKKEISDISKKTNKLEGIMELKAGNIHKKYKKEVCEINNDINYPGLIYELKEKINENNLLLDKYKKNLIKFENTLSNYEKEFIDNIKVPDNFIINIDIIDFIKETYKEYNLNKKSYDELIDNIDKKKLDVVFFQSNNKHINTAISKIKLIEDYSYINKSTLDILSIINKLKSKIENDKNVLERDKESTISFIKEYCDEVLNNFEEINSIAKFKGEQLFKINIPKKDTVNFDIINDIVENILISKDENVAIAKINTYSLINDLINLSTINVEVMKYELSGKKHKINWKNINRYSSGGQAFCITFILLSVIMNYKTSELNIEYNKNVSKMLLLDNPFGSISEESFLEQVFQLANKFNIQIISLTHLQNLGIRKQFDRIYRMDIRKTVSGKEYVKIELVKISNFTIEDKRATDVNSIFEVE